MTLRVPTSYRREGYRREHKKICMRCFNEAVVGLRCKECREDRKKGNEGRKR